jgi:hypothetical protein
MTRSPTRRAAKPAPRQCFGVIHVASTKERWLKADTRARVLRLLERAGAALVQARSELRKAGLKQTGEELARALRVIERARLAAEAHPTRSSLAQLPGVCECRYPQGDRQFSKSNLRGLVQHRQVLKKRPGNVRQKKDK